MKLSDMLPDGFTVEDHFGAASNNASAVQPMLTALLASPSVSIADVHTARAPFARGLREIDAVIAAHEEGVCTS